MDNLFLEVRREQIEEDLKGSGEYVNIKIPIIDPREKYSFIGIEDQNEKILDEIKELITEVEDIEDIERELSELMDVIQAYVTKLFLRNEGDFDRVKVIQDLFIRAYYEHIKKLQSRGWSFLDE